MNKFKIEKTTMSQFEFDIINKVDEKARKKVRDLRDSGKIGVSPPPCNKERLKSMHPNAKLQINFLKYAFLCKKAKFKAP